MDLHIYDKQKLHQAWASVRKKDAAGGMDGLSLQDFLHHADAHLTDLAGELYNNKYIPDPSLRFYTPKSGGEWRPLGLCTVKDKIVQTVVKNELEKIFEKIFLPCSYAYRPGKGHQRAIHKVKWFLKKNYGWIAACDIDNFFDTLNHNILLSELVKYIQDERVVTLVKLWLEIGVYQNRQVEDTKQGVIQGGVISPVLSNLYLHPFDKFILDKGYRLIRYADDFIIMTHKKNQAEKAIQLARQYLKDTLQLSLNDENPDVLFFRDGFVYLGMEFKGNKIYISEDKMQKAISKIQDFSLSRFWDLDKIINKMNESTKSWRFYYSGTNDRFQFIQLDAVIVKSLLTRMKREQVKEEFAQTRFPKINLISHYPQAAMLKLWKDNFSSAELDLNSIAKSLAHLLQAEPKTVIKHVDNLVKDKIKPLEPKIKAAVKRKRRHYERKLASQYSLLINQSGVYLGKEYNTIIAKKQGKTLNKAAIKDLNSIIITNKAVTLSAHVLALCSENEISLEFMDEFGKPHSMLYGAHYPFHTVALAQLAAYKNGKGQMLAHLFIEGKIKNQMNLLKYFYKYQKQKSENQTKWETEIQRLEDYFQKMQTLDFSVPLEQFQGQLFGFEGQAASSYWNCIKILVEDRFEFPKREHRGSQDPFNCLLNYGYGILYNRIYKCIISAGLLPSFSFLHSPLENRPNLILDLIEEFRAPIVDRTIVALCNKDEPLVVQNGRLDDNTRKLVAQNVIERLNLPAIYLKKRIPMQNIIQNQALRLAAFLKEEKKYKPYIARW